nr:hypothetical protein [Tanacetum cinerariifolium]
MDCRCAKRSDRVNRIEADRFTSGTVLTKSENLGRVKQGKEVHGKVFVFRICDNVVINSSLVDMYRKCGSLIEAYKARLHYVVIESVLVDLYAKCCSGNMKGAKQLLQGSSFKDDESLWATLLGALYANYYSAFLDKDEHEDKDKHGLFDDQNRLVCNIRIFEMIKYSFGEDEEYVAIKEHEYNDLKSTNEDACRLYQEIFHRMDEGWMVTRAE